MAKQRWSRHFAAVPRLRFAAVGLALGALSVSGCFGGAPPPPTPAPSPTLAAPPSPAAQLPALALPTLSPLPSPTPTPQPLVVSGTDGAGVSIRREPSTSAERIKVWPEGTVVTPLNEQRQVDGRDWTRVRDPDNNDGWVASEFLTDPETAASRPTSPPAPVATAPPPTPSGPTPTLPSLRPTFTPAPAQPKPAAPAPAITPTTAPGSAGTPVPGGTPGPATTAPPGTPAAGTLTPVSTPAAPPPSTPKPR